MYRAVALAAVRDGVAMPPDEAGRRRIAELAATADLVLRGGVDDLEVLLDGDDVTAAIRTPEVARAASIVSALPEVRRELVRLQRRLGAASGGVVEGRDIGTVVFPDADLKVYLTAGVDVRARRRHAELAARGVEVTLERVLADQRERDARDSGRADSPLRPAPDAIILDTSSLPEDEVVAELVRLAGGVLRP